MKLPRVYHPVSKWEECNFNMWGDCDWRADTLKIAIEFTGNAEHYGSYMRRVTREWPISCENALTDYNINRKAWLGHAACALFGRIPEDVTREAWRTLTNEQQLLANNQARAAIQAWEINYGTSHKLCDGVGETLLLDWNTRNDTEGATRNSKSAQL